MPKFLTGDPVPTEVRKVAEGEFDIAFDKTKSFTDRLKAFVRGENAIGRKTGMILDVFTVFAPSGVRTAREAVRKIIQRKEKPMDRVKKIIKQPSTKAGITVLVALLALVGIDLDPVLIEESLKQIVTGAALVVAGVVALYEMFRDEDDKKD